MLFWLAFSNLFETRSWKVRRKAPRSKFPALLVVALALVALVFVIWRVDGAPSTNDAYASADTIDVVPEVSGRIVELAVSDNRAVKQGDLLFRIDPRPYEANLAKAEASLAALDKQIMLTQRSVDAQQFGADSVNATVEKPVPPRNKPAIRYAVPNRYCEKVLFLRKRLTVQERRSARQKPILMPYCCRRSQPPAPSAAWMH